MPSVQKSALLLVLAALCSVRLARAHPIPFSYLDLRLEPGTIPGKLTVHALDLGNELAAAPETLASRDFLEARRLDILEFLLERLRITADGARLAVELEGIEPIPDNQAVTLYLRLACPTSPASLGVEGLLFPYDPQHQTFVNIYDGARLAHQEILDLKHPRFDYFSGSGRGRLAAFGKFLKSGVHHIFIGWDHILFVVGLLLAGGSIGRLLRIVTAFTLAHSVTLALAALDLVHPPARLVEPAIALSIVYVGLDNLMAGREERDVRVWIALAFGFIHGFGFASVLRGTGLPRPHLAGALFGFNLGVEIGQACIVLLIAPVILALARRNASLAARVVSVGSVVVAAAGGYWFVERVFFSR
jgi:hydrogenase/urease accessory protein HupE